MKTLAFRPYVLSIAVAMVLPAGCGGPQPTAGALGTIPQGNPTERTTDKSQPLLYVAERTGLVEIVSYPAGERVASIYLGPYSPPSGECSTQSGNVWITNGTSIDEYAPSRKRPIARKGANETLTGCSVDPKTNDLAAAGDKGHLFIWHSGGGEPTTYTTKPYYTLEYCGYGDRGNLFIDGVETYNRSVAVFELPRGSNKLDRLSLDRKIRGAGQVQWDGKYVAIQNGDSPHDIYQVKISGYTGTVVNTISFNGLRKHVASSWILGATVLVPFGIRGRFVNAIGVFNYPAGGNPISILKGTTYRYISAVTLSRGAVR